MDQELVTWPRWNHSGTSLLSGGQWFPVLGQLGEFTQWAYWRQPEASEGSYSFLPVLGWGTGHWAVTSRSPALTTSPVVTAESQEPWKSLASEVALGTEDAPTSPGGGDFPRA